MLNSVDSWKKLVSGFGRLVEPLLMTNLHMHHLSSTHIFVPFLNLMSNLVERAGSLMIRMGGNTQEYAKFTPDAFDDGRITQKEDSGTNQTVRMLLAYSVTGP